MMWLYPPGFFGTRVRGRESGLCFFLSHPVKTYVYIDGFNLYYGAIKGTSYKWLDLLQMCRKLLPKNEISQIKYYTAIVLSLIHIYCGMICSSVALPSRTV